MLGWKRRLPSPALFYAIHSGACRQFAYALAGISEGELFDISVFNQQK